MFFPVKVAPSCSYNETLAVSGAGPFYFDYMQPYLYVTDNGLPTGDGVLKIYKKIAGVLVLQSTTNLPSGSGPVHPRGFNLTGYGRVCLIPYNVSKKLAIWDVNDPTAPALLGSVAVSYEPMSVDALGTDACVGLHENFLQTKSAEKVDISDPTAPTVTASWAVSKMVQEVQAGGTHFFLSGQNNSAGAVHMSALVASSFALASTATGGGAFAGINAGAMKLRSDLQRAFSLNIGNSTICSWNISNPAAISLVQAAAIFASATGTGCIAIKEDTSRAYCGRGSGGGLQIDIVDISNPAAMTKTGSISTSGETVSDIGILDDGCEGLVWGQGTGAAIHILGTPPLS